MLKINRVINTLGFENAVKEYIFSGVTNPSEIARLLGERGAICSAVAVELCIERLAIKATGDALLSPNNAAMNHLALIGRKDTV